MSNIPVYMHECMHDCMPDRMCICKYYVRACLSVSGRACVRVCVCLLVQGCVLRLGYAAVSII